MLTRDPNSSRAKYLASLPNVTLIQGTQESEADLHRAFKGVYGAWVNLDGFVLGEMKELYLAFRCYEIARHEGVKHYVWANTDYALKIAGWREEFHWGHNDAKGRVGGRWLFSARVVDVVAHCEQTSSLHKTRKQWHRPSLLLDRIW